MSLLPSLLFGFFSFFGFSGSAFLLISGFFEFRIGLTKEACQQTSRAIAILSCMFGHTGTRLANSRNFFDLIAGDDVGRFGQLAQRLTQRGITITHIVSP